jgi:chromosome partitioning protein
MSQNHRNCSVCGAEFELHFRYQLEERVAAGEDGRDRVAVAFFCSQRCLEASHHARSGGSVQCDACASSFEVELAYQVLFTGGRRHYACSPACRARIREGARAIRLGELLHPDRAAGDSIAGDSTAGPVFDTIPAPASFEAELPPVLDPALSSLPPPPRAPVIQLGSGAPAHNRDAPQVLAIFNHKGGTGKTTTAVTIAAGLAAHGRRVLLVDTDGQGNVAACFGLRVLRSLYHVLVMGVPVADAAVSVRERLDVLPANETLAAAELYLAGRRNRDRVLSQRLFDVRGRYDHVIIDCSPSLSLLNQNALVMADGVLCPVACDYLSLIGVRQVLRTIKHVNQHLGHPVSLWGLLPTMFDARAKICHEALDALRDHFGERCFDPIRLAIKVKEAPAQAKTLLEYAPWSGAASDYLSVVTRLMGHASAEVQRHFTPRVAVTTGGGR